MDTTMRPVEMITLAIDGMTCGHCVQAVTKGLSAVAGVTVRSVAIGSAVIDVTEAAAAVRAVAALEEAGYPARAVSRGGANESVVRAAGGGGSCCGPTAKAEEAEGGTGMGGGCC